MAAHQMKGSLRKKWTSDCKVMRPGKTAEDKRIGAWGNRFKNREQRLEEQHLSKRGVFRKFV